MNYLPGVVHACQRYAVGKDWFFTKSNGEFNSGSWHRRNPAGLAGPILKQSEATLADNG